MAQDHSRDSENESSSSDDLLQGYLDEMFNTSKPPSEEVPAESFNHPQQNSSTSKGKSLASVHPSDRFNEPGTDDGVSSRPKQVAEKHANKEAPLKTRRLETSDQTRPEPVRPYQTPERAEPTVIPSLMPKLKASSTPLDVALEKSPDLKVKVDVTEAEVTKAPSVEQASDKPHESPAATITTRDILSPAITSTSPIPSPTPPVPSFREAESFEALLFKVRGLQLAVPLVSLGSIHKIEGELTPIVGRADWFLGIFRANDRNLQVVDTGRWVMPGRTIDLGHSDYQFVIRLGNSDWGLACDAVNQAIRIENREIKWRTDNSLRPWLAGTVIEKMCALLDVENMAVLLDEDMLHRS